MSTKVVSDGLIQHVVLYKPVFWLFRLDVFPFVVSYSVFFALCLSTGTMQYVGLIALPILFSIHLFLFLLAQWSVKIRCRLGYTAVTDVTKADTVHVIAAHNAGMDRLVKLLSNSYFAEAKKVRIMEQDFAITRERLDFQKVVYNFDTDKNSFVRLDYPSSAPVKQFLDWRGHGTPQDVGMSLMRWGTNEYDIPIPNFLDLYLDHLVAPFFVFQVLCLFLWSLDDYWYYSVFTLLMLMFFEGMMCRQRQASLTMLRNMRRPPVRIYVHRGGAWLAVSSDSLVPGDVISLTADMSRRRGGKGGGDDNANVVPCDALLVRGSCVVNEAMLTGESVPQMKETLRTRSSNAAAGAEDFVDLGTDSHVDAQWKRHMVFSGTSLLLHTERVDADLGVPSASLQPPVLGAPDGGCVAVVIRTGFGTSQGGLMRKILFATERVTGNSYETFYFIGVLVVFAVVAAAVVLRGGLADEKRNKFRLVLHCIMIVTSVVPPELPMELSLAVTNSLAALARALVYCTEPFRISYAGRLDTICFDKTGTLTKDEMILRGLAAPQDLPLFSTSTGHKGTATKSAGAEGEDESESDMMLSEISADSAREAVLEPAGSSELVLAIMGTCHDLMVPSAAVDSATNLIGDPLEIATMSASGYKFRAYTGTDSAPCIEHQEEGHELRVRHKYPFTSELKRMSVVVEAQGRAGLRRTLVFCKGAPEIVAKYLSTVPAFYDATYYYHMSRGRRVLALAYKSLAAGATKKLPRSEVESGLEFAGFLIFDCDLKVDSRSVVRELKAAAHQVVMITGDSVYTAADVARRLSMLKTCDKDKVNPSALIMHVVGGEKNSDSKAELIWRQLGGSFSSESEKQVDDVDFSIREIKDLAADFSLCVVGAALDLLQKSDPQQYPSVLRALCPHVTIFARVSPVQKESIVLALNEAGLYTLMCGDGTNDVGALKAAHVGVSIVNNPEFEKRIEGVKDSGSAGAAAGKKGAAGKKAKGASAKDRLARATMELQEQEMDPTIVKLGDASIASPFTARRTSIDSVLTVMRQGRCTLVTTVQVYKVLALNCLVSAYMMSALYLRGLKQGDTQMTATGLVIAALFFFLSQAKPVPGISAQRPTSSIFAKAVVLSLLGQFIVHFSSLLAVLYICEQYVAADDFSLSADGKFQPNVVNSAVFLLSALMQVNNFVVNYRGHPFTQSIFENIYLWRSVQVLYGVLLIVAGGQLEPLNDLLQMAPFPSPEFQAYLLGILAFNFAACYAVETACQKLE